ncbi:hypothetical protein K9O30_06180 [Clostridium bowmanii]|uniref:hypothetical protein n=1 Tax=Clostridium bowmanii TaxID=132925 RepID=UPI001C0C391E|nr:hypothetical protein [Clostridium bowmanii]MBU3188747.1 hypothetical protein [Clostridium bowmanii]MCA1073332.1 hypothetical protein [Clostridium bowmanii]
MKGFKIKLISFLTALFVLIGTGLQTSEVNATVNTTNYKSSYSTKATKSYTVYITNTGGKYHKKGCRYLKKSSIAIKKSSAVSQGYTACKICKP